MSEAIRYELAELIGRIAAARQSAGAGAALDLSALPPRVEAICQAVQTLPPEQARAYAPLLNDMLGALETLEQEVRARRDALNKRLSDLETVNR